MITILYIAFIFLFGVGYYALLAWYGKSWKALKNDVREDDAFYHISVLIPFRNEENHIPQLIQSLDQLDLKNHRVEFLFVNDHSTDRSVFVLEELLSKAKIDAKLIHLEGGEGKKAAILQGWDMAKGEIILQTDADCIFPERWLLEMMKPFSQANVYLVSGPVTFTKQHGFFHELVLFDFLGLIAIGAAHIQQKMPLICNGANLAYRTTALADADLQDSKASGDDIFLMQSVAKKHADAIAFCKSEKAIVVTDGPQSFNEFWNQRLRWASKNGEYTNKLNMAILIGVWLYNCIILGSLLTFTPIGYTAAALLILIKWLAEERFYSKFESFFGIKSSFKTLGLGQLFHIIYMVILPIFSQILTFQWKERKLK